MFKGAIIGNFKIVSSASSDTAGVGACRNSVASTAVNLQVKMATRSISGCLVVSRLT